MNTKNLPFCVHRCRCGYANDPQKVCTCASVVVTKYQKRISGPWLDRIDIHIPVPRVDYKKLSGDRLDEPSTSIRAEVQAARDIQWNRFSNIESLDIICNADMRIGEIRKFCKLQDEGRGLMRAATAQLNLSALLLGLWFPLLVGNTTCGTFTHEYAWSNFRHMRLQSIGQAHQDCSILDLKTHYCTYRYVTETIRMLPLGVCRLCQQLHSLDTRE